MDFVDPLPAAGDLDAVQQLNFLGLPFFVGRAEDVIPMAQGARERGITHLARMASAAFRTRPTRRAGRPYRRHRARLRADPTRWGVSTRRSGRT